MVAVKVAPRARGQGNEVRWQVSADRIPAAFRTAVEGGIADALATGVLGSYPLVDVAVTVYDGETRHEESTEVSFRSASVMAIREAIQSAEPVLLEPIMALEIVTPEAHMGDVLGDLSSRRGKVVDLQLVDDAQVIHGDVPLAEMFGYSTALRSLSKGRAVYTMEPRQFDQVPEDLQRSLLHR
jgi:elongation factor G